MSDAAVAVSLRQDSLRHMQARDWQAALALLDRALRLAPHDPKSWIARAQCCLALGHKAQACEAAVHAAREAPPDPILFDAIGSLFSQANDQQRALAAFDRALALAPNNSHVLFNRATVYRFLGRLTEAEADYDRVIALKPEDFEAYKNRSELRIQSTENNHTASLEALLGRGIAEWPGAVQIRYALAKEYEDLGRYAESFQHLQAGATLRRRHMRYDIAADVATVDWIIEAFRETLPASLRSEDVLPIFVVGLPRSGTTLVDRILGSHSRVVAAGELNDLALCIVEASQRDRSAVPMTRRDLIARSATLDFEALGRDYLERVRRATPSPCFTDKMPLNYLYCGIIRRALPNARIVHLTRHPLAACYAMYKTLFKDAYPFSYDLEEIGRYYIAYRRLMDHWNATLPGGVHTVSYESLVADLTEETRRLLDYCGLEWQDACTQFHLNPAATTTASAAQVRRPVYQSSVAQWRHYAVELAPLERQLRASGIAVQ